jgi:FkbM family methyltransferase
MKIAFPDPVPLVKLSHILFGYRAWQERKLPGFVEVEPGDVVVDCGAYVGGFTLSAAEKASAVHAFEPERANFACLARNFDGRANVVLNRCALYDATGETRLNVSESSVEHSLLAPDDGTVLRTEAVEMVRLDDYCRRVGLDRLDFVKIEAEGVELEVFDGLGDLRPRKLAIDVSPERNGESPAEAFSERLMATGYEIRQRGHVMFGRFLA